MNVHQISPTLAMQDVIVRHNNRVVLVILVTTPMHTADNQNLAGNHARLLPTAVVACRVATKCKQAHMHYYSPIAVAQLPRRPRNPFGAGARNHCLVGGMVVKNDADGQCEWC